MATTSTTNTPDRQPRLLEQVRDALRLRHYSLRTEQAFMPIGSSGSRCFTANGIPGRWGLRRWSLYCWDRVSHSPDNRCPTITPITIALAMNPFSVYCTFIQLTPKEASHGTPSFRIAVPAQDGGHSGLWRDDWPLAGTSGQRVSARFDVLYGVCGTSADSANGYLPAHRTRPTCHEAFYRAAMINCAGQKWL